MKMIKTILALAAAFAVTAGVTQAVAGPVRTAVVRPAALTPAPDATKVTTPVTFALTAYVEPGNTIQAVSINNLQLLQKMGAALNANLTSAKLCVNTNGHLVITTADGFIVYDLTDGAGSNWVTSITAGINHSFNTNFTVGGVGTSGVDPFNGAFSFWDPIFAGTQTPFLGTEVSMAETVAKIKPLGEDVEFIPGSDAFNVKGHAVGGYFYLHIGYQKYSRNSLTGTTVAVGSEVHDNLEISDGSAATFACSLAAGVYKQSFIINAAGVYDSSSLGHDGVLWGTVSLSGTQTGGQTFLDPFNAPFNDEEDGGLGGNYGIDHNDHND